MLWFERSAHIEKKLISQEDQVTSPDGGHSVTLNGVRHDAVVDGRRDILQIKKAVFDSCNVAGFILNVDEKLYLMNKKMRELLGYVQSSCQFRPQHSIHR